MPLYEYHCEACGHRFEVIQKFSDPPTETCPKCGSRVHKLQSAPAFHLKGTGWYATDYAKKDQGGPAKPADSKDETKSSDSADKSDGQKSDKADKPDKAEKSDKSGDGSSSASGTSTTATGSSSPPPAKSS